MRSCGPTRPSPSCWWIDDVGCLPLSRPEANYLFQVISHRYERSSVILTSNKSVAEWREVSAITPLPRRSSTGCSITVTNCARIFKIDGRLVVGVRRGSALEGEKGRTADS